METGGWERERGKEMEKQRQKGKQGESKDTLTYPLILMTKTTLASSGT